MELLKKPATMKLPEQAFTGDAWADVIYRGEEPRPTSLAPAGTRRSPLRSAQAKQSS